MKSLSKGLLALLSVGLLDVIVLALTWIKHASVVSNLNANANSLGPLWQGWLQAKHLEHFMFIEGGILVLIALFSFVLWNRRAKRLI